MHAHPPRTHYFLMGILPEKFGSHTLTATDCKQCHQRNRRGRQTLNANFGNPWRPATVREKLLILVRGWPWCTNVNFA